MRVLRAFLPRMKTRTLALALLLTGATLQSAYAITSNPIDPNLPLTTHASVLCGTGSNVTGAASASCFKADEVDGTSLPLQVVIGASDARADLLTGTLRAKATSQTLNDGVNLLRQGGLASATLYDTITILNIPLNQSVPVELRMTVHGAFTLDPASPFGAGGQMSDVLRGFTDQGLFGASGIRIFSGNAGTAFVDSSNSLGTGRITNNSVNGTFEDGADLEAESSVTFLATASAPTFSFTSQLFVDSAV